jgi:hypothetical protein
MQDLEFYLNWYEKEEERKVALENSLNIPIGVLTVIYGLDFYLFSKLDVQHPLSIISLISILIIIGSFAAALIASLYLYKSYNKIIRGYTYKAFPFASQLLAHKKSVIEYYKKYASTFPGISGDEQFEIYLINKLAEYIDNNAYNNDLKANALYKSKRWLFISLLFIIFAIVAFVLNSPQTIEGSNFYFFK